MSAPSGASASASASLRVASNIDMAEKPLLQFLPPQSQVDTSFWSELARRKLHEWGLSDAAVPLAAAIATGSAQRRHGRPVGDCVRTLALLVYA